MGAPRALARTVWDYRLCVRCHHMAIRHTDRGHGPCGMSVPTHDTDERGRTVTRSTRCTCPRFMTTEELF